MGFAVVDTSLVFNVADFVLESYGLALALPRTIVATTPSIADKLVNRIRQWAGGRGNVGRSTRL